LAPPESGYQITWDDKLPGFGVRVTAAGAKSFIAESRVNGRKRRVTLGRHGKITANEARKRAKRELGKMSDGRDPVVEKRLKRALSVTLAEVVTDYLENRRARGKPLKPRTVADIEYHMSTNFPDWQKRPVVNITREMVKKRYARRAKSSPAQANQSMRVLRAILNHAAATYRTPDGARIIADNPVDVLREANMLRAVEPRKNQVPLDEIGRWWSAVQKMRANPALTTASRSAADLVALLALTGLRIGEARSIRWDQVDLETGGLRLTDTKNRTDLLQLPLSTVAVEILKARRNESRYVFPARSGDGHLLRIETHLSKLAKESGITVTAHDLRRTFSTVAGALNVELWRTKALMGHKQRADVTLHHYKDLSDVLFLKPEADRIARHFEQRRRVFEAGNIVQFKSNEA
jgi:integrase